MIRNEIKTLMKHEREVAVPSSPDGVLRGARRIRFYLDLGKTDPRDAAAESDE